VVADGVGVWVGGAVAGGLVWCGVTVGSGVAVRCGDGVADGVDDGAGLRCGVRRGVGRGVCDGVEDGALDCCPPAGESPAALVAGGLTHW
jgi:hypothetical protein